MVNFGPLAAEIISLVWRTSANLNGFRVLTTLLHGTLLVGVSQTAALNRGRNLYSAGRPSRWALAHISSLILNCPQKFQKWNSVTSNIPLSSECKSTVRCEIAYNRPAEVMALWRFSLFNAFNEATLSRVQTSIRRRHVLIQDDVCQASRVRQTVYDRLPTSQRCSRWLAEDIAHLARIQLTDLSKHKQHNGQLT